MAHKQRMQPRVFWSRAAGAWMPCKKWMIADASGRWCRSSIVFMPFQRKLDDQKKKCPSLWILAVEFMTAMCQNCTNNVKIQMIMTRSIFQSFHFLRPCRRTNCLNIKDFEFRPKLGGRAEINQAVQKLAQDVLDAKVQPVILQRKCLETIPLH